MRAKTFILKLVCFISLFCLSDYIAGYVFRYLNSHSGDKFAREEFIRHDLKTDMIILGSSRATHHYMPSVLADSMEMSVYNCGQRGNGIIYEYGRLNTILDRYVPKFILVDVYRPYDFDENDNSRYLDFLKPDYGKNSRIDSLFWDIDKYNRIKMMIQSYRYNSTICDLLLNCLLKNRGRFDDNGFMPLKGIITERDFNSIMTKQSSSKMDDVKTKYFERLVLIAKLANLKIAFIISPYPKGCDERNYVPISAISKKYDIPLFDYSNDIRIINDMSLWKDGSHLNSQGAQIFSMILASDLKKLWTNSFSEYGLH